MTGLREDTVLENYLQRVFRIFCSPRFFGNGETEAAVAKTAETEAAVAETVETEASGTENVETGTAGTEAVKAETMKTDSGQIKRR